MSDAAPALRARVPASSANLGPGFDALGLALTLHLEAWPVDEDDPLAQPATHPAVVAFRLAGGTGGLAVRSAIPVGRGLGFSGAARVAGLLVGHAQARGLRDPADRAATAQVLAEATRLEGHADNVAASLCGGVVATAAGHAVRVPLALDPVVLLWVPELQTSTDASRKGLGAEIPFGDAVFNVGRTALLVAALAAGRVDVLRCAAEDRLHQPSRLPAVPASEAALTGALRAGAWCAWLSGSGPSVAALAGADEADAVAASMGGGGDVKRLRIDHEGAVLEVVEG